MAEKLLDSIHQKNRNFVFRSVAGETILVPLRSQEADLRSIYVFNETAAAIWQSLDGKRSGLEIARELARQYEAAPDDIARDVEELLGKLAAFGALEPAG